MTPLVLVDVSNLAFRSHYVHKHLSYEGTPTGVLYGFLRTVLSLRARFGDRLLFCWDKLPGLPVKPNWRLQWFPAYKDGRDADPEKQKERQSVYDQLLPVHAALEMLGYGSAGASGYEADDIIGMLATRVLGEVLIYSGDKDLFQLLDANRVKAVVPGKPGGFSTITQKQVEAQYGVGLKRWAMYLALGADKSDGIHVMPGVGPKTAAAMLTAGLRLDIPWHINFSALREKYARCEPYWQQLQQAYEVARIPREPHDPRLSCYPLGFDLNALVNYHRKRTDKLEEFTGFLAARGMQEFLGKRRQFFEGTFAEEQDTPPWSTEAELPPAKEVRKPAAAVVSKPAATRPVKKQRRRLWATQ